MVFSCAIPLLILRVGPCPQKRLAGCAENMLKTEQACTCFLIPSSGIDSISAEVF